MYNQWLDWGTQDLGGSDPVGGLKAGGSKNTGTDPGPRRTVLLLCGTVLRLNIVSLITLL